MNMETPNAGGAKDFQVTGVSRSGRVRKKSSKLLDFQSPDEVDKKPKRSPKTPTRGIRGRPILSESPWKRQLLPDIASPGSVELAENADLWKPEGVGLDDKTYSERNVNITRVDEDDELDELVADIVEGVEAEAENATESMVRQSLYMTEKANKKKVLKDGRVVTERTQRRDKGKTRLTAYSMWVREQRKSINTGVKWDSDATNNAHRLSELWANVPNNEKNVWRRKAKRVAISSERPEGGDGTPNVPAATASSAFLNRATTSRTRKLAAAKLMTSPDIKTANKHGTPSTATLRGRKDLERQLGPNDGSTHKSSSNAPASNTIRHACPEANSPTCSKGVADSASVPMSGIAPIDAAAHLKLLGESLSIIGERLKEHEGQITVSGSLSVLLDSLLCSIGPLMCLATCIPGLDRHNELNDNLAATLDNIAYVMPGL